MEFKFKGGTEGLFYLFIYLLIGKRKDLNFNQIHRWSK